MGIISIAETKEDMVLAGELRVPTGRLLFSKGTRLTSKNLRTMKTWGVIEVDIEGISQKDIEEDILAQKDPEIMRAAEDKTRELFIYTDLEHPAIQELFRLCTIRRADDIIKTNREECFSSKNSAKIEVNVDQTLMGTVPQVDPADLLQKEVNLSTLPTIVMHFNEAIRKPTCSASDIANVIGKDTNLSARLLRIVNSAFYGFPGKIDSLSRAVAIVGTNQLSTLAVGISIIEVFKSIPQDLIDMKSFWKHSIACGIISRTLASYKYIQNTERLFVAGLIHDIGRLLMYNYTPINARIALLKARHTRQLLSEVERETMNLDHATLGAMLLKKWKLPPSLENIIKHHHVPNGSNDPLEPSIVHLANIMTNALRIGSSGEALVPPLGSEAWECIGLSPNVLLQTTKQLDPQLAETIEFFFADEI